MFSWICLGLLEPGAVAAACSMAWIKTFTAVFSSSLHCSLEEIRHLIKGDHFQIVIQIGMHRIRDDQQFLVLWLRIAFHHGSIGIPAEIAGVGLFPMNDQHC